MLNELGEIKKGWYFLQSKPEIFMIYFEEDIKKWQSKENCHL